MLADLCCKFIEELQSEHGLSLNQIARRLDETIDQIEQTASPARRSSCTSREPRC